MVDEELNPLAMTHKLLSQFSISLFSPPPPSSPHQPPPLHDREDGDKHPSVGWGPEPPALCTSTRRRSPSTTPVDRRSGVCGSGVYSGITASQKDSGRFISYYSEHVWLPSTNDNMFKKFLHSILPKE